MQKIKISHEVPKCLLDESLHFNDYNYALPHLLDKDETYENFFYESKKLGIECYLDNSVHENGVPYKTDRLLYWIEELLPTNFFVPDIIENMSESIVKAKEWTKFLLPDGVEKVPVVQAKSLKEAIECTQIYKDLGYKKLAYPYASSYYNEVSNHPNKDIGKALGRVQVISKIYEMGLLTKNDRIHLLGTSCPFEFSLYKDIECIESIDTSNPVMCAIENIRYNHLGIHNKPKSNLNTHFDIDVKDIDLSLLGHNLNIFKQIINTI